jgi:hypothetical protein
MIRSGALFLILSLFGNIGAAGANDPALFPVTEYGPDFPQPGSVRTGFIDQTGKIVIPLSPDYMVMQPTRSVCCFSEGLQSVVVGLKTKWRPNSWGYLDTKGNFAIEPQFGSAEAFSEGVASAFGDGGRGYIDHSGKFVIPPQFQEALPFSEGLAQVTTTNYLMGYIDHQGKWVIPAQYAVRSGDGDFHDGLACVGKKKPAHTSAPGSVDSPSDFIWGYIDKTGAQLIDFKFSEASGFHDGLACVRDEKGYGYIDKTGAFAFETRFSTAWEFSEGFARVETKDSHMAYINKQGQIAFEVPTVVWAEPFSEGLAEAEIRDPAHQSPNGRLHGFIDHTGKFVIAPEYFGASSFCHGLAQVVSKTETGYIDKTGSFVWKIKSPDMKKLLKDFPSPE